jgi:hypothetical protein
MDEGGGHVLATEARLGQVTPLHAGKNSQIWWSNVSHRSATPEEAIDVESDRVLPPLRDGTLSAEAGRRSATAGLRDWMTDGFSDSLRTELAKYDIEVVAARSPSRPLAVITLGAWSDRAGFGRSINVELLLPDGERKRAGRIPVPDLEMTTLDVAAQLLAALIAKSIRASDSAAR